MRSRTLLFVSLAASLMLPVAAYAAIPFFGPIIPQEYNVCPASWGLLITVINNVISLLITLAIVFVAPLTIAYAGFLYVVNPVDPSGIARAKKVLTNTVVGIVIALAGWMIVDAVMAVLYNKGAPGLSGKTWSELITSGDIKPCIDLQSSLQQAGQTGVPSPGLGVTPGVGKFSYNPGIDAQVPNESAPLATLLSCMSGQLPSSTVITSISDSKITSGAVTIEQCAASGKSIGCAHTANSCHYGGRSCVGSSYAVDLSAGDLNALAAVAQSCGASTLNEGNHLHVSVGAQNGCGCDASLD